MTSIFTGFTPTKPACEPIANPKHPSSIPRVIGAESEQVITTSAIGALPSAGIGAPSFIGAESKTSISNPTELSAESSANISVPSNLGAESKPDIDAPVSKIAESKSDISAPSTAPAKAAATIAVPSEKTPRPKKTIDTPDNLGAEDAATVSAPSSKAAQAKATISAPSNVGAESASTVPVPASKTAAAKPAVSAPSSKTAIAKPDIDAPSNIGAENKASIDSPQDIAAQNYGTNLVTYSEQFDDSDWSKVSTGVAVTPIVTPNFSTAPDGSLTADRVVFDLGGGTSSSDISQISNTATTGSIDTCSIYLKSNSGSSYKINLVSIAGEVYSALVTDKWRRFSVTSDVSAASGSFRVRLRGGELDSSATADLLVWGAQVENSLTVNNYIKTESTIVTTPVAVNPPSSKTALAKASVPTPSAKTAESASVAPAPSTLTANPATAITPPFPLNHARILYENVLQGYNSITDTGPTGTAINAIKPNTWERWKFSTAANTLIIDFSTAVDFDTVCIASHNLSNAGATVAVYYEPEPGGVFLELDTKTPTNNEPICFYSETLLDALTIEIRITGASGVPQIGYISAGESLQMQRPFFNGHIPITDGDVTEYYSNRTESGEIIGQQIRRQGYQTSADWRYIDDTWYRTYFDPFKKAAKLTPFFFMWNLLEYPDDVGFCRISQDINCPMQNGFTTKRTINMTLLGAG